LKKAVDILVPPFVSFDTMATAQEYAGIRSKIDEYLDKTQPTNINSVNKLLETRAKYIELYNNATFPFLKSSIKTEWMEVEDVIRVAVEIGAVRKLEERFKEFKTWMIKAGCIAAGCLVALLAAAHRSPPTDYGPPASPPGGPAEFRVVFPSGRACTTSPESPSLQATIGTLAAGLRVNGHLTLRVTGSADTQPLGIEARQIYGNNVGLALARAHCVAGAVQSQLAVKGLYVSTVVAVRGPRDRRQADTDRSVEIRSEP
jgi:hypothetical protein